MRTAGLDKRPRKRTLSRRSAAAAFDGFLRGERGQDHKVAGAGQQCQELANHLQAGCLNHQQQHMLLTDECLGLDGDAMAGGSGRRDAGKQQLSPPGQSRAVFGSVPVLRDEQSDESLLLPPRRNPRSYASLLSVPVGVHGQERTSYLDKTLVRVSMIWG